MDADLLVLNLSLSNCCFLNVPLVWYDTIGELHALSSQELESRAQSTLQDYMRIL